MAAWFVNILLRKIFVRGILTAMLRQLHQWCFAQGLDEVIKEFQNISIFSQIFDCFALSQSAHQDLVHWVPG